MLKQTTKLTLVEKKPYAITGKDGKNYTGIIYEGFDSRNRIIRFTSKKDSYPVYDRGGFEETNSRDFELYGKTKFNGEVKWQDDPIEAKELNRDFREESAQF